MIEPKIRFTNRNVVYEEKSLSEISTINPKSDIPLEFEYVDLESVSGTEMIKHRTEQKATAPSRAQRLAKKGDIFFQTVRPYQRNNYFFDLDDENYVFSTGYAQIRTNIHGKYLFSLIQSNSFLKQVLDNCSGTSFPAINPSILSRLSVYICTDKQEQQAIGNYFTSLDKQITASTSRLASLKQMKAASLQSMFPQEGETVPKIRFKGFEGEWKKVKFSDIAYILRGLTYSPNDIVTDGVRVLRSSNIDEDTFVLTDSDVFVSYKCVNIDPIHKNDILITAANGSSRLVGKHTLVKNLDNKMQVAGGFMLRVISNESEFLNASMNTCWYKKVLQTCVAGGNGAIGNLNKNDLSNTSFYIPNEKEERNAIANYFTSLDKQIALETQRLEKLKQIKSACLDKMFV